MLAVSRPLQLKQIGVTFLARTRVEPVHISELVFEVTEEPEGGYSAECLTESIFTQGDTWDELRANVKEATEAFFFDGPKPKYIRLHLVRNEVLTM
jgi:predicted RNase H-like HicB family nuclease